MFYATPWFEMLCGKRRVNKCCVEAHYGALYSIYIRAWLVSCTGTHAGTTYLRCDELCLLSMLRLGV